MSKARDLADFQGSASALTTGTLPVDRVPYVGRRNLIINGGFDVWQRGESSTADNTYATADRWFKYAQGDTSTWGKYYDTERGNCLYVPSKASNGYVNIRQRFEGMHIPASGQEFTFSVWLKVSTGTAPFRIEVWNLTDGSNIFGNYNLGTITTEWQKFTVTFSLDSSDTNDTFHIMIGSDSCVGGATMYFNQAQLELGSVATPFEHRSYGEELALCQRYYSQSYEAGVPAGTGGYADGQMQRYLDGGHNWATFPFSLPVPMRAKPTMRMFHPVSGTEGQVQCDSVSNTASIIALGTKQVKAYVTNTYIGTSVSFHFHWTADAEL